MTDYTVGDTFDVKFTTRRFTTGVPFALASGVISAYPDNSVTQITAGITLSADFDGVTGLNNVRVVATGGNGYAAGSTYYLVITTGTVDSVSVVGEVVGEFTLGRSAAFARLGAPAGASVSADIAAIEGQTDDIGAAGAGLTAIPWNAAWDAEVESEVEDAVGADVTSILADTNELQVDWTNGGRLDLILDIIAADTTTDIPALIGTPTVSLSAMLTVIDDFLDTEVAAILADTNELQTDWANGGRLDLILDIIAADTTTDIPATIATIDDFLDTEIAAILAAVDTEVAAIKVVTDALTAAAAGKLAALGLGTFTGTVNDAGATITTFIVAGFTEATNDHFNGRLITFTSGALLGQQSDITDYVGATQTIVVTALTEAPANGISFVIT